MPAPSPRMPSQLCKDCPKTPNCGYLSHYIDHHRRKIENVKKLILNNLTDGEDEDLVSLMKNIGEDKRDHANIIAVKMCGVSIWAGVMQTTTILALVELSVENVIHFEMYQNRLLYLLLAKWVRTDVEMIFMDIIHDRHRLSTVIRTENSANDLTCVVPLVIVCHLDKKTPTDDAAMKLNAPETGLFAFTEYINETN